MGCCVSRYQKQALQLLHENMVLQRRLDAMFEKSADMDANRLFECKICFETLVAIVFLPCGHCMTCHDCGSRFVTCPLCCMRIEDRTYITFP